MSKVLLKVILKAIALTDKHKDDFFYTFLVSSLSVDIASKVTFLMEQDPPPMKKCI